MFSMITNFKPLRKYKYKNEVSLIRRKLDFLSEEALSKRATKADIVFWDTLLDRLLEIKENNAEVTIEVKGTTYNIIDELKLVKRTNYTTLDEAINSIIAAYILN